MKQARQVRSATQARFAAASSVQAIFPSIRRDSVFSRCGAPRFCVFSAGACMVLVFESNSRMLLVSLVLSTRPRIIVWAFGNGLIQLIRDGPLFRQTRIPTGSYIFLSHRLDPPWQLACCFYKQRAHHLSVCARSSSWHPSGDRRGVAIVGPRRLRECISYVTPSCLTQRVYRLCVSQSARVSPPLCFRASSS